MEQTMKEIRTKNPLGYQPIGRLLMKFAIPSVISMLVNAVYNIVDQIFIGQGVGYLGNAATTVAFPIVTIILAVGTGNQAGGKEGRGSGEYTGKCIYSAGGNRDCTDRNRFGFSGSDSDNFRCNAEEYGVCEGLCEHHTAWYGF